MNKFAGVCFRFVFFSFLIIGLALTLITKSVSAQTTDQWTTSLHDVSRDGASTDTNVSTSQAPQLTKLWSMATGEPIASQPAIVNGVAYVGSWNGYEYAINDTTGAVLWKTYLGVTMGYSDCDPQSAGVSSAATVQNGVVYVGGGNQYFYALNASTGAVEWQTLTGNSAGTYDGHYNWSSPLIVNGYVYVGVASLGDCPLIQGQLLQVNITNGQIANTLNLVPNGEVGGGIWTSPSYNPTTNTIYAVTGTEEDDSQTYAQAIVAINASSLAVTDYWHLPESEAVADSDWTTSPMLYTDTTGRQLVLATNKNGYTYALLQSNLAAGPVWSQQIAIGNDCAACGFSTVSSAAIGGGKIYQAGGTTLINGQGYGGSVQALNPTTGAVLWQHTLSGPVIGAVTYANGMVIDGGGSALEVLNAANGQRIYSYDTTPGSWIYAAPAVSNGVIVTGNTYGSMYAFGLPSSPPPNPPADPNCPNNWLCQDIGNPTPSGSESVSNGTWNVTAGGSGAGGTTSDSFRLMSQSTTGDAQIIADVTAQQAISSNSQAGIMIRQSNDPGSPFYAVFATANGPEVMYRNTFGANTTTIKSPNPGNVPVYLEIQRHNDTLQAATSTNGTTYTLVPGATATVVVPYSSLIGLASSSGTNGVSGTATFTNVSISTPNNTPVDTPSGGTCPTGWNCGDIGNPAIVGSQSLTGGTWTIGGTGSGVDATSDQFHYVWQPVAGDATMTARITAQSNTSVSAKTGLMMRADTSSGSAYYGIFIQPGGGMVVQYRDTNGLPIFNPLASFTGALPQYMQIVRAGTTFSAYTSSDGNNWQPVVGGTISETNLSGSILAGLATTSTNTSATSNVTADSFSIANGSTTPPTTCPGNWTCTDIGDPIPAGSQYYYNGVWSVLGGGKDIWDTKDEFHYVAQSMNGNGTVSAEVTSQDNTDVWAKAGLMFRSDTTDPAAPYYAVLTTPGNGTVIQYRTAEGDSTGQITGVTTQAPVYLKVARSGNTFTAYTSTDGVNWTAYPSGSVTVNLPATAFVGMANTDHSQFQTGTANFNDFTLTPSNSNIPSPWVDNDVDNATPAGSASASGGVFTINGGGNDIWTTAYGNLDQSHYVSQPFSGDGSIVARVTSQTNTSAWAKSGIMMKQFAAADAPYVLLAITPTNGIVFQNGFTTSTAGGNYTFPNAWLKLSRSGNTITGSMSTNGTTWTTVGTATLTATDPITAGMFVTSHASGSLNASTFDNVSVSSGTAHLPSPWSDTDINATVPGSASYANGVFTVSGAGNDIWTTPGGNLDQFHYAYQPENGSQTIVARVTSQTNTSAWAKAGIMIKQSTTPGSPYALIGVTPSNGIVFQYNFTNSVNGPTYTFPNAWLKLSISGSTVTAYSSQDGMTWTQVGSATMTFNSPATLGMFVTSHASGSLSTSTFDNVSVTSP